MFRSVGFYKDVSCPFKEFTTLDLFQYVVEIELALRGNNILGC